MLWAQAAIRHPQTLARSTRRTPDMNRSGRVHLLSPARPCKGPHGSASSCWRPSTRRPKGFDLARHASELAAALAFQDHEVHVLTCNCPGDDASRVEDGVHVHDMPSLVPIKHFDRYGRCHHSDRHGGPRMCYPRLFFGNPPDWQGLRGANPSSSSSFFQASYLHRCGPRPRAGPRSRPRLAASRSVRP